MIVIGVDPGATGAVVALRRDKSVYICLDNKSLEFDNLEAPTFFAAHRGLIGLAAIERQQYMPKGGRRQGGKSAFSIGRGFGFWLGFFQAYGGGIEIITPRPREWQKFFFGSGTVISDPKERSIREARRRLPGLELVPPGCRVPSHGRADAGLIALYALERVKRERGRRNA
jgi:hypothetical protein